MRNITCLLILLFVHATASAQSTGGATLVGTVRDPTGAIIPAAAITVVNIDSK